MKGDFTRSTFNKKKHYRKVKMQQGRVIVDADWNEQTDIDFHYSNASLADLIGPSGTPFDGTNPLDGTSGYSDGFKIVPVTGSNNLQNDYQIKAGHYYVDGILCENEDNVNASVQGDLLALQNASDALPTTAGYYFAYLDVWERLLTPLDDPHIRDVALKGADTSDRAKIVWQVKVVQVGNSDAQVTCLSEPSAWKAIISPSSGKLRARVRPQDQSTGACILPPEAGYRGLGTQLYRVEMHNPGQIGSKEPSSSSPTFKWSQNNGCVAAQVLGIDESNGILSVNSTGRDSNLGFVNQLWVEINDDRRELAGMPGSLIQILDVDQNNNTIKFDPNSVIGDHITEANFPKEFNPKIRRWDGSVGLNAASVPATNFGYVKLENGIEVKFENGTYATGDYWLIRASTATGDIEWVNNEYEMQWSHLTDTDQSTLKDFLTSFGVDWVVEFAVDPNNSNSIVGKSADSTHAVSVQLNNDNTEATLYIDNNITFTFPVTSQANDLVLHAETPQPLSPVGIKHHFARLAVLSYGSTGVIVVQDCRNFFSTAIISQQPSQPANANTGLIKLHVQSDLTLYGPFLHYIKDLIAPPAILLGLAGKEVLGQVGLTEDWALYQFGERQPLFKPYDITVDSFRIHYEHLGAQETTMLRWWAIPALNQPDQTNVPIITISPAGGPAGTQAKVAGTYFSGSTVKLIHGSSALTDANIDDRGSFSITFQIPTDLSNGAFRITATDNSPGNLSASATFTIGPVVIEGLSSSAKSTSIGRTATRKGHAKKTKE